MIKCKQSAGICVYLDPCRTASRKMVVRIDAYTFDRSTVYVHNLAGHDTVLTKTSSNKDEESKDAES